MDAIEKLKEIINSSASVVFFGGAGVSSASGIPDFRSSGGLYNKKSAAYGKMTPESLLHIHTLMNYPEMFFAFYRDNMLYPDAVPNEAHIALAELEGQGRLSAVITQNIDGLHTAAGSKNVIELHGSVRENYCMGCLKEYSEEELTSQAGVPRCELCGDIIRPRVTLYGERLDETAHNQAMRLAATADTLIVGGTSLVVYPAAYLVDVFRGRHLVIINKTPTKYDDMAELIIRENIENVLPRVL